MILVLWAELITMAAANIPLFPASYDKLATLVMAFSLPAAFWLVIRDHVVSGLNSQFLNKKLKYFTGSPHALKGMLEERKVLFDGETPNTIIINPGQPNNVTTVLSLFCGACSHAFNEIDRLSSKFDFITFEIILFPGDSGSAEIIRHVLQRKLVSGDVAAFQYLRHWCNHSMNALPSFDATMVNTQAGKQVDEIMSSWSNWLQLNNISVTPSIYVNQALKPTVIRLDEFDVLFRDLDKRQWQPVENES